MFRYYELKFSTQSTRWTRRGHILRYVEERSIDDFKTTEIGTRKNILCPNLGDLGALGGRKCADNTWVTHLREDMGNALAYTTL